MKNPSEKTPHILCIGDLILDQFCYGQVDRISPEAPVPVLHIHRQFSTLGGAGNVVRNLEALKANVTFLSAMGEDEPAKTTQLLLDAMKGVNAHIVKQKKTSNKTRFISQGQQLIRVDDELVSPLSECEENRLISRIETIISSIDLLILSDYNKGLLSHKLCQQAIQQAILHNKPVIVDPKGKDYSQYAGATLITPNLKELREICGETVTTDQKITLTAQQLMDRYNFKAVLVTRGADGMTLVQKEKPALHVPTQAREVYDVSGAGDTVVATLAVMLSQGMSLSEATKLSNFAAGIAVNKIGTAVVTWEELENALSHDDKRTKVLSGDELLERVQKWRHHHLKIGFTNGCFDLLHQGHLHILQEAKKTCDRLIVALNTDSSVKSLKGHMRPIHSEDSRAHVLAALEMVDAVILFDEDTPFQLIKSIVPDVLIKGADYTVDTVVGADIVMKNGGKVHLVELLEGHSTTKTVSKMVA